MQMHLSRVAATVAGAAAVAALVAGCNTTSSETTSAGSSSPSPVPSSSVPNSPVAGVEGVTPDAAKKLCSDLQNSLSDWRVQGPTLGKPALNILVQTWAAQNGAVNVKVLQDRSIIDKVTTDACPDARQEALKALELPDLASGLVGW